MRLKSLISILLVFTIVLMPLSECFATKDTKEKVDDANEQVEAISEDIEELLKYINELNTKMKKLAEEVEDYETQIDNKEQEIADANEDLLEAEENAKDQYESMKLRIQYVYENGQQSVIEVFFASANIVDFINRIEYVNKLQSYDRQMLKKYKKTCKKIEEYKKELNSKKENLSKLSEQAKEKKQELSILIEENKEKLATSEKMLKNAEKKAKKLEKQLEEEEEEKRLEEERQLMEQIKAQEALEKESAREEETTGMEETVNNEETTKKEETVTEEETTDKDDSDEETKESVDASDVEMLAAIIECEAGSEIYEGKLAVGSVILNRVNSAFFPNSISGVIYQAGQFSPVSSGRFAIVLSRGASDSCIKAANEVLSNGATIDALFFRTASSASDNMNGTIIGNHIFYSSYWN